jgi:hypothetical protein
VRDGPFAGMTPDPESRRPDLPPVTCEKCQGNVFAGDWPFCNGKPEDHRR